jgi:hypothetical protein
LKVLPLTSSLRGMPGVSAVGAARKRIRLRRSAAPKRRTGCASARS